MCFFLWADQARMDRFLIFWMEKNVFFDQKSDVTKKSKKSKFFKGLVKNLREKNRTF